MRTFDYSKLNCIIDNEIMDLTIKYYLDDFIKENNINTLVLGCTHYPLLTDNIRRLYPEMKIINSSKEAAIAASIVSMTSPSRSITMMPAAKPITSAAENISFAPSMKFFAMSSAE